MVQVSDAARKVRMVILESFVLRGLAPNIGKIMDTLGMSRPEVLNTFPEIALIDTFWVEEGTENIRILSPFANISTPYKVTIDGVQKWHAVCGIEALGIWVFFPGKRVEITTYCRDCGEPMFLTLQDGQIVEHDPEGMVAHLGVRVSRWMEDLPFA